jgi:AraC-like DNA-binding protein
MVCLRCILLVKDELQRLNIGYNNVKLGEAIIDDATTQDQVNALNELLCKSGLQIIDSKKSRLVEQIKILVIEQVHYSEDPLTEKFSGYIARKLNYDYTYLSNLFASTQGMTLERYIIWNKIEKVKELLVYDEMTIAQIALKMNYSSAAHLSKQFKQIAGFSASYYKKLKQIRSEEGKNQNKIR